MRRNKRLAAAIAILLAAVVLIASGCAYDGYRHGPYARAPAHSRPPHYYDYHYYPSARVYFHLYTGHYYYRSRDTWIRVRNLPAHAYLGPRDRVKLRIWSDRPYVHYRTHRQRFLPRPGYRPDRSRDRFERSYNRRHHQQYLRRYRR